MIRVREMKNTDADLNTYLIDAVADTKSEVVPGARYIGLPEGATIEQGSTLMTADWEVATMKSDGTWSWA